MQALDRKDAEADANGRRLLNKCYDGSCDCSSDRLGSIVLRKFNFYRHNNQVSVVIEPGHSLIHARLRASLDELNEGEFTVEGDDWSAAIAGGSEEIVGEVRIKGCDLSLAFWALRSQQ